MIHIGLSSFFVTQTAHFNPIGNQHTICTMNGFIFPYTTRLLKKEKVNHNVVRFSVQRPFGFNFIPGQAVDLSIDQPGCELEVAPFTIISAEDDPYLEFIIKIRPNKDSLTYRLSALRPGAVIQLSRPWDTFEYRGQGHFIAAGTGIVPFMPILDYIQRFGPEFTESHLLVYATKSKEDVLFEKRLRRMLGNNFITRLSSPTASAKLPGRIDLGFLQSIIKKNDQYFYICGPKPFEFDIMTHLMKMGVDQKRIQTGYKFGQSKILNS